VANVVIKASRVVRAAALLLQREIVLPRLAYTDLQKADFVGAANDTVSLSIPAQMSSRTRVMRANTALTFDELTETKVDVKLDTHVYKGLNIRDEELTLDITDFAAQVLQPQIVAVAEGLENMLAAAYAAADPHADPIPFVEGTDDPYDVAVDAFTAMNKLKLPLGGRYLLLGANVAGAFLKSDKLSKVNESGNSDALRDATITRVAGFNVVQSLAIDPDAGYACDRFAVAWIALAPNVPDGAPDGGVTRPAAGGLPGLRYLRHYNPNATNGPVDQSLVDAFAGAKSVEEDPDGDANFENYHIVPIDFTGES
jgi:hypothetical protein